MPGLPAPSTWKSPGVTRIDQEDNGLPVPKCGLRRSRNVRTCEGETLSLFFAFWSSFLTSCDVTSEEGNLHFGTSLVVEDMVEDLQTWAEFITKVAPELDELRKGRTSTSLQSDGSGDVAVAPVATVDLKAKTARARSLYTGHG